jgi:hypothetical protein
MGKEVVVDRRQQNLREPNPLAAFGKAFTVPTIRSYGPSRESRYSAAKDVQGAVGINRVLLLDRASKLLTQQEPFTAGDMVHFTDVMLEISGRYEIGDSVSVTSVPDRIPRTGVKEITIQHEVGKDGASVNVVYQTVGDRQDKRYVLGEDFSDSKATDTSLRLQVGKAETPLNATNEKDQSQTIIRLNTSATDDAEAERVRREVCTDIFVAQLANAGAIERSQVAANTVRELISKRTPVKELALAS